MRLDLALQHMGLAASRSVATRLIQAGAVSVNGRVVLKASLEVGPQTSIELARSRESEFVSRAGSKLQGLLEGRPEVGIQGYWVDFGQSTGGFTDCLLRQGAMRVLGFDVGHDQLHPRLKSDPRVRSIEGINLRQAWPSLQKSPDSENNRLDAPVSGLADLSLFDDQWPSRGADGVVIDVSFISTSYVIEQAITCLRPDAWCIALIKPQFELGADPTRRKQWLRKALLGEPSSLHDRLSDLVAPFNKLGLHFDPGKDLLASVLPGQSGNQEYFLLSRRIQANG